MAPGTHSMRFGEGSGVVFGGLAVWRRVARCREGLVCGGDVVRLRDVVCIRFHVLVGLFRHPIILIPVPQFVCSVCVSVGRNCGGCSRSEAIRSSGGGRLSKSNLVTRWSFRIFRL